jgi:hypothetical protein
VVHESQFIPSAGRTTRIQSRLSPLTRQFSSYPLGFANWMVDAAFRSGLDQQAAPIATMLGSTRGKSRNWLPYARWLVAANMINRGSGNLLNLDLGEKAVSGIVNLPFSDQPFAPLPLPPVPGLLASLPQAIFNRDIDKINPIELPYVGKLPVPKILVPGGLAVSHAFKMVNQTRDGFLLDRNERAIDKLSQYEKWLEILGFTRYDSSRDRRKLRQLLNSQDRLKDYRRQMALATIHGETDKISHIQHEYSKEFTDAGPLVVSRSDVLRVSDQQRTDRLRRTAQSLSPIVRKRYNMLEENDPGGFHQLSVDLGVPMDPQESLNLATPYR